jgi:hypothetical protein
VFLHDTDLTHTLADADVGKRIRLRVRATTVSGTREVDSAPTAPVAGQKPSSLASPTVEGKLREGEIILSAPGVWLGTEPLAFSNRWERCDPKRCVATGDRLFLHKLVNADVGKRMRGTVTVSNAWGSTTEHTPQSAIVKPRVVPPERLKPFPRIEIKGVIRPNGVELLRLAVRAPRRSTLRVGCRGRGCPYRSVRGRMRTTLFLVRRLLHRTLAVGTVIEMRVTARNKIGKYTRFRIVRNRPPARVDRCLVPGEPGPSRCSSRR